MERPPADLVDLSVRNGPIFDSALFTFRDGFEIRIGNIANTQIEPVKWFLEVGADAFEWSGLSDAQRTNCYYVFTNMGLLPRDLL